MSNHSAIFQKRLAALRQTLLPHQAILISNPTDIQYFSGFVTLVPAEREALLIVSHQNSTLLYAHFSPFEPVKDINAIKGVSFSNLKTQLEKLKTTEKVSELLIDELNLFVSEYHQLTSIITTVALDRQTIWQLRMVKDNQELAAIAKAAQIAKQVAEKMGRSLATGQTELDVCDQIERQLKQLGSEAPAFPTIVAFGPHSALPHHQPTDTKLTPNTPVLLDFGATYQGYRSDMTRTIWFGNQPSQLFSELETIVMTAYQASLATARTPNQRTAKQIDTSARQVITDVGYGDQFIHTTGHGVGLDIHEPPSLNWNNDAHLEPGMIITIEPGIYLENQFGYRYENTIQLTADGAEELTR